MFGGLYSLFSLLTDVGIINLNQKSEIQSTQKYLETDNSTKIIELEKSHKTDSIK